MILVADCGGTRSDFALINNATIQFFKSSGYNPTITRKLEFPSAINKNWENIEKAFFYLAGYQESESSNLNIPDHIETCIKNDLYGAAYASMGHNSGIIVILGTGSSAAIFENGQLIAKIPSLGYIMDNEGGATHLGKLILKDYFSGLMDQKNKDLLKSHFNTNHKQLLAQLYSKDIKTATLIAEYSKFLSRCDESYRKKILEKSLDSFFQYKVQPLKNWNKYTFYFCGGIAYYYQKEIVDYFRRKNILIKSILKEPINNLALYHKRKFYGK